MRRNILVFGGIFAFLIGLLWVLQGLGVVNWPRSSTMIDQSVWAVRGAILMVVGLVLAYGASRA